MSKHWKAKEFDESLVAGVISQTGLPPQLAGILVERGIHEQETVDKYMFPDLHTLSSPYDLPDMRVACEKVWECLDNNKKIVIFGDLVYQ